MLRTNKNNQLRNPDAKLSGGTFKTYLQSKGLSQKSIESNEQQLCYYLNWSEDEKLEVENTTHNDLIAYIKHLQKKDIKQITVQKYTGSLKHYFNWLVERQIIKNNPCENLNIKGVQRKQLYHILKKLELEKLYESYLIEPKKDETNNGQFKSSELTPKRNKVILGLMIWQGLGTAELSSLQVKDVKLREGKIYIAGGRKSNEREMKLEATQILDLMEYTLQIRKELLQLRKKKIGESEANGNPDAKLSGETESLIVSTGQGSGINNLMTKLVQQLRNLNPNVSSVKQIRTSVITHWLKNYNLREVQQMAGHRFVSSTEAYLINDLDDLQEDIGKFHPIG